MADGSKPTHLAGMRVLFLGMAGILSRIPLTILLNAGVNVCGLVLPASILPPYVLPKDGRLHPIIPAAHPPMEHMLPTAVPGILQLAAQHQLPVYAVRRLKEEATVAALTAVAPDLICVSCFNQILLPVLLQTPRLGCLNCHPSWLPHFRGPSPLFWQFRAGQKEAGVTVHFMDEGLDTGDIALQRKVTFPDGISGAQAEHMIATRGGQLLLEALQRLSEEDLPRQPQPPGGSYQHAPTDGDFRLDVGWSAQRAFNFMRGTAEWGRSYPVLVGGQEMLLQTAVSFNLHQTLPQPILWQGQTVSIQFSPGVLAALPRHTADT